MYAVTYGSPWPGIDAIKSTPAIQPEWISPLSVALAAWTEAKARVNRSSPFRFYSWHDPIPQIMVDGRSTKKGLVKGIERAARLIPGRPSFL